MAAPVFLDLLQHSLRASERKARHLRGRAVPQARGRGASRPRAAGPPHAVTSSLSLRPCPQCLFECLWPARTIHLSRTALGARWAEYDTVRALTPMAISAATVSAVSLRERA